MDDRLAQSCLAGWLRRTAHRATHLCFSAGSGAAAIGTSGAVAIDAGVDESAIATCAGSTAARRWFIERTPQWSFARRVRKPVLVATGNRWQVLPALVARLQSHDQEPGSYDQRSPNPGAPGLKDRELRHRVARAASPLQPVGSGHAGRRLHLLHPAQNLFPQVTPDRLLRQALAPIATPTATGAASAAHPDRSPAGPRPRRAPSPRARRRGRRSAARHPVRDWSSLSLIVCRRFFQRATAASAGRAFAAVRETTGFAPCRPATSKISAISS